MVGAGPVGLTLAMDLAWRGVAVTVLELRGEGEPPSVKCNHVSARSMEVFRRLGVARTLRDFPQLNSRLLRLADLIPRLKPDFRIKPLFKGGNRQSGNTLPLSVIVVPGCGLRDGLHKREQVAFASSALNTFNKPGGI